MGEQPISLEKIQSKAAPRLMSRTCIQHCILQDPRITTAIIVIGCPDYISLMSDRARLSKLDTWTSSSPPGSRFIGSTDFPHGLVEAVQKYDPVGLWMGTSQTHADENCSGTPSDCEKEKLISTLEISLQGKRILNLAGGADKLVPYRFTKPFINRLQNATALSGLLRKGGLVVEDIVYEGIGHEMTSEMVKEVDRFVAESLKTPTVESAAQSSKM